VINQMKKSALALMLMAATASAYSATYQLRVSQDGIVSQSGNAAPEGAAVIDGVPALGEQLTVNTDTITDDDGLGLFSYQWYRNTAPIESATLSSYTVVAEDLDQPLKCVVSWTDQAGTDEQLATESLTPFDRASGDGYVVDTSTDVDVIAEEGRTIGVYGVVTDAGGAWLRHQEGARTSGMEKPARFTFHKHMNYKLTFEYSNEAYGSNYYTDIHFGPWSMYGRRSASDYIRFGSLAMHGDTIRGEHTYWEITYTPIDANTAEIQIKLDGEDYVAPRTINIDDYVADGSEWPTLRMRSNNDRHKVRNIRMEAW